jgi:hypothetical protein
MLTFATEIPIDPDTNLDDLVRLALEWIAGSPHTGFVEADLKWDENFNEATFEREDERLDVLRFKSTITGMGTGGVRYTKVERDRLEWITTVVGFRTSEQFWVGIRLSCDALLAGTPIPAPRKPHVVKMILQRFGGGKDGDLEVSDKVVRLTGDHIEYAASMIAGRARNQLPIVYISAGGQNGGLVDTAELARWLGGSCHVVEEPNRAFAFRLMDEVQRRNPYGGAIGLYWPGGLGRKIYLARDGERGDQLQRSITDDVRVGLAARRPLQACTWARLAETAAKARYDALRADKSASVEEYVTAFDEQLKAKSEQLDAANREIFRLQALAQGLEARSTSEDGSLLNAGAEKDYYDNEISDVIIDAIAAGRQTAPANSRRQHIIDSVLNANQKVRAGEKLVEQLKGVLRDYRTMDAKCRSQLQGLGFTLSEDGKHYKATFNGDARYMFTISKTSGDHRAGLNLASDIRRTLF